MGKENILEEVKKLNIDDMYYLKKQIDILINGKPKHNIECLNFTIRTLNVLRPAGIIFLEDIKDKNIDLRRVRNLGKKSYLEILSTLESHNMEYTYTNLG